MAAIIAIFGVLSTAMAGVGAGLSNVAKNRIPIEGELIKLPNLPDTLFIFENDELHEVLTELVLENRGINIATARIREISEKLQSLIKMGRAFTC